MKYFTHHEFYMKRCLELANLGLGSTYPNPLVGSVIVYENKIIGEGFHLKSRRNHAEVNAINSVENKELLSKSTIYVSLEPCSHFGKTPPCADLIIKNKIPNVVIGTKDSFSKVNGQGIEKLKNAGINVICNVLQQECLDLNKRFFTFHNKKRPYIIIKFAQTKNGFISNNSHDSKKPFYITNEYSLQYVHLRRTQEQAILIGKNTAINDYPSLNSRFVGDFKNPIKIIIDSNLETLNHKLPLFDSIQKTYILNKIENKIINNIECIKLNDLSIKNIVDFLYSKGVQSLIVEGGSFTIKNFINENIWDEAEIFTSNKIVENGIKSPDFNNNFKIINELNFNSDKMMLIRNLNS